MKQSSVFNYFEFTVLEFCAGALLASAGMDQKVYIWNAWEHPGHQIARCLTCHTGAVKDVRWSLDGTSVLSCGFDETARLSDVETASQIQVSVPVLGERNCNMAVCPKCLIDNVTIDTQHSLGLQLFF